MTLDERIATRRVALTTKRAAVPDDDALPAMATRGELAALQQQRLNLDRQIAEFEAAVAVAAALGDPAADERWRDQLAEWRAALCAELLMIKSPIRDAVTMGRSRNLTLSIKMIDFGLRQQKALEDSGYDLTTLRLGQLMREAGYEVVGADPDRNYVGRLPWHGSLPEVEHRIAALAERRTRAQAALDALLMTDEERAGQEAESKALNDALNSMTVKLSANPNAPGLRVVDRHNDDVDEATLTEVQRRALARAREALRGEPVTT